MFRFPGKINTIKYKPFFPPTAGQKSMRQKKKAEMMTLWRHCILFARAYNGVTALLPLLARTGTLWRGVNSESTQLICSSLYYSLWSLKQQETHSIPAQGTKERPLKDISTFHAQARLSPFFSSFIHGIIQCTSPFNTHLWRLYRFITHDNTHIHVSKRWTSCRNFKQYHFSLSFPVLKYLEMLFFWIWHHEW